ncbi:hypothetical protein ABB37_04779 [Leptomonas pyrrhocoris]|uniref:EF-hand domain-containing protein n=1 Tax=Leptomonas pyrrhocoris TaxID=157538 RepID=A0A0M9G216_LEPPY|nr:hypothetical protein ABB37_04779 [Leptomonas pyrrhocoris]KPA80579.1 hypothetical protein ABB37_04779 [Leptomonas pyrrhocoris]|eukprot:XP_015659018.1 hypothetical protein ABB37_04779 [Leptomonas pyrrhocoris]
MSDPPPALIEAATRRLREVATRAQEERSLTSPSDVEAYDTQCFAKETARINRAVEEKRTHSSSAFFPALYLRARDPAGDEATRLLRSTCKAFELDLRFKEIEKLDEMHAKLWTLLNAGDRRSVTLEEYDQLMREFNEWASVQYGAQLPPPPAAVWEMPSFSFSEEEEEEEKGEAEDDAVEGKKAPMLPLPLPLGGPGATSSLSDSVASSLRVSASPERNAPDLQSPSVPTIGGSLGDSRSGTRSQSWGAVVQHIQRFREQRQQHEQQRHSESLQSVTTLSQRSSVQLERVLHLAEDQPALGNVLYLCSVPPPRPDMQLFLSCPRNAEKAVDIAVMYQTFAKQVSLVKCEAELIMWDSNNDGRLSEDEVENYVKDLAPRIAALTSMSNDLLPFYCCTVSRRLFWDLDPGNRGVLRIHSLLQSSVMNEWVSLQLMSEDDPQNWFGAAVTQQLYNKFVMLDTRNKGTLNVDNLRAYKKGLPTVIDDGLPLDTSPLCALFIDRYFETNTLMTRSEMDYRKFVDFVIAVELLPQCSRPHFFWNILDLDGTGVVTPMIVNQFFRETHAKLVAAGLDVPSRETVVQEVFDLVEKAEPLRITRAEFVRSPQAGLFVGLLIDCLSFWTYENREQR